MIGRALVLVQIAIRNLFASFINVIIGGIILVGTCTTVVGGAMLDSLETSMSRSVIGSVAGHLQVYSAKSKDELSLFGDMGGGDPDLSPLTEFARIKQALETVPNVKTVVPMGTSGALVTSGNTVDLVLAKLRDLYKAKNGQGTARELEGLDRAQLDAAIEAAKAHVRQIIRVLEQDITKSKALIREDDEELKESFEALATVSGDAFWSGFEADPFGHLELLENKVAPLVVDADLLFIRYVGTDLDSFQKSFDRMRIVDGQKVPEGQRGFLIAKFFYEESLKLKNARRLDLIKEALDSGTGRAIKGDPVLERLVKENRSQTRDIVLQLDGPKTEKVTSALQQFLQSKEADLSTLLSTFFETDDANFAARYEFFYAQVAPLLTLYRVRVGDTFTIKAFTRAGYVQSVNVKVYGTFAFDGLEKSPLAGSTCLMDLMSFRDLYGYLTTDKLEELKQLKASANAKDVTRDTAEDALFGGEGNTVVAEATAGVIDEKSELSGNGKALRQEDLVKRVYSREEIESGVVLNAAVMLNDPEQLEATTKAIEAVSEKQGLGLKVVSWQKAAGLLGQLIFVAKAVLFFFVAVIFVIAMVIINNAVMMATLQRTKTIGTMRAIGAQRGFVLSMVLLETLVLGLAFGLAGMGLGSGVMSMLGKRGIAAPNDIMYFFFSGPKLLPTLSVGNLIAAFVIIVVVSSVSTLIPALIATRVSPLRAMQSDE